MEVLLVEDHPATAHSVRAILRPYYSVTHAATCAEAMDQVSQKHFDVCIIDLNLPDGLGTRLIQQNQIDQPRVLVLSGQSDVQTKVFTLRAGADDYLTKPFTAAELAARVEVLLRRSKATLHSRFVCDQFTFLVQDQQLSTTQGERKLTQLEAKLLTQLLYSRGQVVSHHSLRSRLWTMDKDQNALEVLVKNLRKKLALPTQPSCIETIYGVGYRLRTSHGHS